MSKHMRPVYDERDDEIDAHSKSRAWDFVVVCIEVFTIGLALLIWFGVCG